MIKLSVLAAGVSAAVLGASVYAAAPAKSGASASPIANYWMDVSTRVASARDDGGGGRPSPAADDGDDERRRIGSVAHMLNLRLSSREKPSGAPQANHFIPAGMEMGPSLPLDCARGDGKQSSGGGSRAAMRNRAGGC